MDATVATGAAAMMAIRVLLDYDVPEENIQLVSLLMAEIGVHSIAYAFPKVHHCLFFQQINLVLANHRMFIGKNSYICPGPRDQRKILCYSGNWQFW